MEKHPHQLIHTGPYSLACSISRVFSSLIHFLYSWILLGLLSGPCFFLFSSMPESCYPPLFSLFLISSSSCISLIVLSFVSCMSHTLSAPLSRRLFCCPGDPSC
jgi:hypothetical protein